MRMALVLRILAIIGNRLDIGRHSLAVQTLLCP
jgi:hypothetical protein